MIYCTLRMHRVDIARLPGIFGCGAGLALIRLHSSLFGHRCSRPAKSVLRFSRYWQALLPVLKRVYGTYSTKVHWKRTHSIARNDIAYLLWVWYYLKVRTFVLPPNAQP